MIAIAEGVKNEQMLPAKLQRLRQNRALIRWWLYFVCALILAMVVVGGATRLTESGLSITEWKPIHASFRRSAKPSGKRSWKNIARFRNISSSTKA